MRESCHSRLRLAHALVGLQKGPTRFRVRIVQFLTQHLDQEWQSRILRIWIPKSSFWRNSQVLSSDFESRRATYTHHWVNCDINALTIWRRIFGQVSKRASDLYFSSFCHYTYLFPIFSITGCDFWRDLRSCRNH